MVFVTGRIINDGRQDDALNAISIVERLAAVLEDEVRSIHLIEDGYSDAGNYEEYMETIHGMIRIENESLPEDFRIGLEHEDGISYFILYYKDEAFHNVRIE